MSSVDVSPDTAKYTSPEQDILHRKVVELLASVQNDCLAEQGLHPQLHQKIQKLEGNVAHYQKAAADLAAQVTELKQQNGIMYQDNHKLTRINQEQNRLIQQLSHKQNALEAMARGRPEEAYQQLLTEFGKLQQSYGHVTGDFRTLLGIVNGCVLRGALSIHHLPHGIAQMINYQAAQPIQSHSAPPVIQRPSSQPIPSQRPALTQLDANCAKHISNTSGPSHPPKIRTSSLERASPVNPSHLVNRSQPGRALNSPSSDLHLPGLDGRVLTVAETYFPSQSSSSQYSPQNLISSQNGQYLYQQQQHPQNARVPHNLYTVITPGSAPMPQGIPPTHLPFASPVSPHHPHPSFPSPRSHPSSSASIHAGHGISPLSRDSSTLAHALTPQTLQYTTLVPHPHLPGPATTYIAPIQVSPNGASTLTHVQSQSVPEKDSQSVSDVQAFPTPPRSSKSMSPEHEQPSSTSAPRADSQRYSPPMNAPAESLKRASETMGADLVHGAAAEHPNKKPRIEETGDEDGVLLSAQEKMADEAPQSEVRQVESTDNGVELEEGSMQSQTVPTEQVLVLPSGIHHDVTGKDFEPEVGSFQVLQSEIASALPTPPTTGTAEVEMGKQGERGGEEGTSEAEEEEEEEEEGSEEGSDDELALFESAHDTLVQRKRGQLECTLCCDRHIRDNKFPLTSFDLATSMSEKLAHFATVHSYAWGKMKSLA